MFAVFALTTLLAGADPCETWNRDSADYLQRYLRVDTTNPPGNELRGAQFFAAIFKGLSIEHQVFAIAPGRANFWAILRGDGSKRPIILSNHLDVVGVEEGTWKVPPF